MPDVLARAVECVAGTPTMGTGRKGAVEAAGGGGRSALMIDRWPISAGLDCADESRRCSDHDAGATERDGRNGAE